MSKAVSKARPGRDPVFDRIKACKSADRAAERARRKFYKRQEELGKLGIAGAGNNRISVYQPALELGGARIACLGEVKAYVDQTFSRIQRALPPKTWKRVRAMKSFVAGELEDALHSLNAKHRTRQRQAGLEKLRNLDLRAGRLQNDAWIKLFKTQPKSRRGLAVVAKFLAESKVPYTMGDDSDALIYLQKALAAAG
jgi:hypothetical protein